MTASSPPPIRVLLIDDHAVVRAGLRMLVNGSSELTTVGEAGDGARALALAAETQPNIIVLDLDLAGESGIDLLPGLFAAAPAARVIILTGLTDPAQHERAVRLGAAGLIRKDQAAEVLLKAIHKVHAGEAWLDRAMVARVLNRLTQGPEEAPVDPEAAKIAQLTAREREVVTLICEGLSNKQIGDRLVISEPTVRHHLTSIFEKLKVTSRLELVIYAYREHLAKPA